MACLRLFVTLWWPEVGGLGDRPGYGSNELEGARRKTLERETGVSRACGTDSAIEVRYRLTDQPS